MDFMETTSLCATTAEHLKFSTEEEDENQTALLILLPLQNLYGQSFCCHVTDILVI